MVITVSRGGYIKRSPLSLYRAQRRGGKGRIGATTKEEDLVEHLFVASTHAYILAFTSTRPHALDQGLRPAAARARDARQGDREPAEPRPERAHGRHGRDEGLPRGPLPRLRDAQRAHQEDGALGLLATCARAASSRSTSRRATSCSPCASRAARTRSSSARARAWASGSPRRTSARWAATRPASSASSLRKNNDVVVEMDVVDEKAHLLSVTENGYGKRSEVTEYRFQGRGGSGVINVKVTEKNGAVVGIKSVTDADQLLLITERGHADPHQGQGHPRDRPRRPGRARHPARGGRPRRRRGQAGRAGRRRGGGPGFPAHARRPRRSSRARPAARSPGPPFLDEDDGRRGRATTTDATRKSQPTVPAPAAGYRIRPSCDFFSTAPASKRPGGSRISGLLDGAWVSLSGAEAAGVDYRKAVRELASLTDGPVLVETGVRRPQGHVQGRPRARQARQGHRRPAALEARGDAGRAALRPGPDRHVRRRAVIRWRRR